MPSIDDELQADSFPVRGCRHINRLRHALRVTSFPDHLAVIEGCSPHRRCNTAYCKSCRSRHVKSHTDRMLSLWRTSYNSCEDQARKDIRFVTVLHALTQPDISEIAGVMSRAKIDFNGLKRSFPGLRIHGRIELEVIDTDKIFSSDMCVRKRRALQNLNGGRSSFASRDVVLVHSHTLFMLGGNDPESVRAKLATKYDAPYGINMKCLYDDKSVDDNIIRVCGYMMKDKWFYNNSIGSSGGKQGTYLSDESLSFISRSYMNERIGIDKSLIWSKEK